MNDPIISVVLPIYNGSEYLREAVESILNQAFVQFELIVIDDGSTDSSLEILEQYCDPRLRLITQPNRGLAATLNRGIELAQGQYIARMDQDDISRPERFTKQVAFLEQNPHCGLVGTWAEIWEVDTRTKRKHTPPADNSTLQFELLFDTPFVHSSVMLRREAIERVNGYSTDPSRQPPEDYELWSRLARHYELANLPEILHVYREVPHSMSRTGTFPFMRKLLTISTENISWAANDSVNNVHIKNIAALFQGAWECVENPIDYFAMRTILSRATIGITSKKSSRYLRTAQTKLLSRLISYKSSFGTPVQKMLFGLIRRSYHIVKKT